MNLSKRQLNDMDDFQINMTLANIIGLKVSKSQFINIDCRGSGVLFGVGHVFDFNNPNSIIPLQFKYDIGISRWFERSTKKWVAECQVSFIHENPLRAISCCLILLLQNGVGDE